MLACGLYWRVPARDGAWRILEVRDSAWAVLAARASDAENSGGAWRRVEGPMKTIFHRKADRRVYFPIE